jgi:ribonuclease R
MRERGAISGKVIKVIRGGAFIRSDALDRDVFAPAKSAGRIFSGDWVDFTYQKGTLPGRLEGKILRIREQGKSTLTGILKILHGKWFLDAFDAVSFEDIPVSLVPHGTAEPGMVVEIDRDSRKVVRILGDSENPSVDLELIKEKYQLYDQFSHEATVEAERVRRSVEVLFDSGRRDFRDWTTFTIDDIEARDFDDAVSVRKCRNGNTQLGVHIADVAHYVKPGSPIDLDARRKGVSVYFPDSTLHMLPEILSCELCSLRPGEDKLCLSVLLEIDRNGEIVESTIHPSVIRSQARLTYDTVFRFFCGESQASSELAPFAEMLNTMRITARRMKEGRMKRGGLDFDFPQIKWIIGENNRTEPGIFRSNEAHAIIEEFMVAANQAAAEYLVSRSLPCIFRIHLSPGIGTLDEFRRTVARFGYSLSPAEKIRIQDLQSFLEWSRSQRSDRLLALLLLRSMKPAAYSTEALGHYGLGIELYAHFTSPIRRYPDLIVHRLIKDSLQNRQVSDQPFSLIAKECSELEKNAEDAERELTERRIYRLLKKQLGGDFEGIVVDVVHSGIVVELSDYLVSGMVYAGDLGGEYFSPKRTLPPGGPMGTRYSLGEKIRVKVAAVNPYQRRMILVPVPVSGR